MAKFLSAQLIITKKLNFRQTFSPVSSRELLENEQSQQLQQAGVEEQLNTVRQSLQDQNSAAHSLHSELRAQLENIQTQVTQVTNTQARIRFSLIISPNCHIVH